MAVYERGKSFRCKFRVSGRNFLETFTSRAEAVEWEQATRHALQFDKPLPLVTNGRSSSGGRLDTLGKLYSHTRHNVWERAKGSHSQIIYARQAVEYFGSEKLASEIDEGDLSDWASSLFADGAASGTVNRKLSALSRMLTESKGLVKPKFPRFQELSKQIRFLTTEDEVELLERLRHFGLDDLLTLTIWQLDTGMRLGETLALSWDHINDGKATAWHTKGGKPRTIPLTQRALGCLAANGRHERGPFKHLKVGKGLARPVRSQWNKVQKLTGLDRRIHDLRHTCASRLVQKGVDLLRVKDWMGHKDLTTTLIYAHLAPNDLDVCVKALEMAQPVAQYGPWPSLDQEKSL